MPRRLLKVVLLLATQTGCPHEWGRGGTLDMAMEKDMREYPRKTTCTLDEEEWVERCKGYDHMPSSARTKCPEECRPRPAAR